MRNEVRLGMFEGNPQDPATKSDLQLVKSDLQTVKSELTSDMQSNEIRTEV